MDNFIEDTRIVYTWKLNYTTDLKSKDSNFCQFPQSGEYANKFCLTFCKNADNCNFWSYYLSGPSFNIKGTMEVILFMLDINLKNSVKRKKEQKLTCICNASELNQVGFPYFCWNDDLHQLSSKGIDITLGCEIIFCKQLIYLSTGNSLLHYRSMQNQFKQLLENDELCDFTIVVGAQEIKVHKAILAARSPVLKTMLTINMTEKKTNRLEIKDIDLKTLKAMIQFIYTNEIDDELDPNEAEQLLIAADKYQLKGLKDVCTNFMERSLNTENISQYMLLAARYKSKSLMHAVKTLIKCNLCALDIACDGLLEHL